MSDCRYEVRSMGRLFMRIVKQTTVTNQLDVVVSWSLFLDNTFAKMMWTLCALCSLSARKVAKKKKAAGPIWVAQKNLDLSE